MGEVRVCKSTDGAYLLKALVNGKYVASSGNDKTGALIADKTDTAQAERFNVPNSTKANGAQLIQWYTNGGGNQKWSLEVDAGYVRILNEKTQKYLAVKNGSTDTGAAIVQTEGAGSGDEALWSFEEITQGYPGSYVIKNKKSGLVLGSENTQPKNSNRGQGQKLVQGPNDGIYIWAAWYLKRP